MMGFSTDSGEDLKERDKFDERFMRVNKLVRNFLMCKTIRFKYYFTLLFLPHVFMRKFKINK